ncbi:MAG TPA: RNA polymerase sigma factor SigJ [Candidatus Baltobacteraceae bacterium]|nr:RNA polymerase sigma factor SigJ [Candidatus Baltobacteraceae bacterium]
MAETVSTDGRPHGGAMSSVAGRFEAARPVLVRHAYRMLGIYGDAEDVVQDAFLRWVRAAESGPIADDQAFLRATVTHLCLDRLRSARVRRETYFGPWLPEPVLHDAAAEPEASAALADDLSFALLLALDRLSPLERAAFLLHDGLGVPFTEIAQTLGRTQEAVRKLASRARTRIHQERAPSVPRESAQQLRDEMLAALRRDDITAIERLLTKDVLFMSDGGGKATAATAAVVGRERVSKLLAGLSRKGAHLIRKVELVMLNGLPGYLLYEESGITTALAMQTTAQGVAAIYVVRNPDKLRHLTADRSAQALHHTGGAQ